MERKNEIFSEITQLNEKLYILLKQLETTKNREDRIEEVNELYRIFHTLKSLTLMAGLTDLSDIIHMSEQIFSEIKNGRILLNEKVINAIYNTHQLVSK